MEKKESRTCGTLAEALAEKDTYFAFILLKNDPTNLSRFRASPFRALSHFTISVFHSLWNLVSHHLFLLSIHQPPSCALYPRTITLYVALSSDNILILLSHKRSRNHYGLYAQYNHWRT